MIKKDDFICEVVNSLIKYRNLFNISKRKTLKRMKSKIGNYSKDEIFILLNGPSLLKQDIGKLKGRTLLFVNRGFKHELYKLLQPKFHVFVDPKMISGEWPVTWLDEILEMVPEITFIMPVSWSTHNKFKPYIKKGISIFWIPDDGKCTVLGVSGSAFNFAISQKFKRIYFTGFDANGLGYELIKASSHFYGTNEENNRKSTSDLVIDLFMHSRHLHDLNRFSEKCKKKNIEIFNLTEGGLLDMFPRINFSDVI